MDVYGTVSSALQTSAQIITFCVKVRSYVLAPKHIRASAENVENVGRNFRLVAVAVYECVAEARFNPNFDIHPDLEKTLKEADIALKATSKLVEQWARRLGLSRIWKTAEMSANEAFERSATALPKDCLIQPDYPERSVVSTSPTVVAGKGKKLRLPSFCRSRSTNSSQSFAIDEKKLLEPPRQAPPKSSSLVPRMIPSLVKRGFGIIGHHLWWRMCFVAYGSKDLDKAVGHLLHERLQLSVLTNTLPFQSSKRLKKAERDIVNAWRAIVREHGYAIRKGGTIMLKTIFITNKVSLPLSYDIFMYNYTGYLERQGLKIVSKSRQPSSSLAWMILMLQHIPHAISRDVGILPCIGHSSTENITELVFDAPRTSDSIRPVTLRARLLDRSKPPPSLSDRVRIAQTLVASIIVIHSLGIVHRFLNPEGIILFPDPHNSASPGDLYLMGFGQSRREGHPSDNGSRDKVFRDALYIHHDIWLRPRTLKYVMKHDIYSLGICLLEIGLWQTPFVAMRDATKQHRYQNPGHAPSDLTFDTYGDFAELGGDFIRRRLLSEDNNLWSAEVRPSDYEVAAERREVLVDIAKKRLTPVMGQIYCDAVIACLEIDKINLSNDISDAHDGRMALNNTSTQIIPSALGSGNSGDDSAGTEPPLTQTATTVAAEGSSEGSRRRKLPKDHRMEHVEVDVSDWGLTANELGDVNKVFGRFMLKLMEVRNLSDGSAKTINITRNILKRLERINI